MSLSLHDKSHYVPMTPFAQQILIAGVFVAVYVGMALGRWPGLAMDRTAIAFTGAVLIAASGAAMPERLIAHIDFSTLLLLFGLMIVSAQFGFSGFYERAASVISHTGFSGQALLALVIGTSGFLSLLLVNDIVVLALVPLLCRGLVARGLDPRPFLLALAMAANAGSAATLVGNPQNILIGEAGGLDFWTFLKANAVPALLALLIVQLIIGWRWRAVLAADAPSAREKPRAIDRRAFMKGILALILLLLLFATPVPRPLSALAVAALILISRVRGSLSYFAQIDWPLLVLFASLFIVTGAFAESPLGREVGTTLGALLSGSEAALLGVAAIGSNSIGNVPMVTGLISLLPDAEPVLLTGLALYATLAGNLLLIGSLANIIMAEQARRQGIGIGFLLYLKDGLPIGGLQLLLAFGFRSLFTP
ncbi:MAG: SLC13 family permease [Rhodothalassiaceae bacterium]